MAKGDDVAGRGAGTGGGAGVGGGGRSFSRDAAERTLLRIKAKVQGFEDPTSDALSVQGHVNR